MNLRLMTAADYAGIYKIWLSCAGMGLNDVDDSEAGIARCLHRNPTTCFVAWEAGFLCGAILAGHDGRRGFIYHTAVHPDCRRRGIGSALVSAALSALKEEGITKVALVAFARNGTGNAFWERQGFTLWEDLAYRNRALRELVRRDT